MYHFHLVAAFSAVINGLLACAVLWSNPRRDINRAIFVLGLAIVDWNVGVYILGHTKDPSESLLWFHQCTFGIFFIPAAIYELSQLLSKKPSRRYKILIGYLASGILFALSFSPLGTASGRRFGDIYRITAGPVFWVYYIWLVSVAITSFAQLYHIVRDTQYGPARLPRLVAIATAILSVGLSHDSLHVFGLNYYPGTNIAIMPYATLGAAIYGLILSYGLLSEQILDIRISISRNTATVLRILFLIGTCYLTLLSIGALIPGTFTKNSIYITLVAVSISTIVTMRFFPKLFGGVSAELRHQIIGDRFEYHDKVLSFITEYHSHPGGFASYLEEVVELIYDQFTLSSIGAITYDGDAKAQGSAVRSIGQSPKWNQVWGEQSALKAHFKTGDNRAPIDMREGAGHGHERAAREVLFGHSLEFAFPITIDNKKHIGLIVIGPRRDGKSLNKLDVEALVMLSQHIATRAGRIAVERNEELQQANQAKDRFLASVNHEIRNPLNGITGVVQMLKEYCIEARAKYLLGTLQSCTDQLRTTMDDVLDFNQIGPEVAGNHPSAVDVLELVRSITSSYDISGAQLVFERITSGFEQIELRDSDMRVWCDGGKFSHILMNYITNALKYGIPPGAHVQICAEFIGGNIVRVKLAVTSTGPTLSQEELVSLFTPLTRGQRAHETKAHGMGLGLALCKKLAHAMGGNVGVESAKGQTTFWFAAEFPLANSTNTNIQPLPVVSKMTGRHALAVEDEPYNRLVLGYHLNRFGISAVWAEDGKSALAAAQNRSFDLIVTDWILPDMDGEELLTQLRKTHAAPLPPVIVVSAYSTASKRATGLAAGATAFVSKPIDETKLAEAFAACDLGPAVAGIICDDVASESIDLSALKKAGTGPNIIESFLHDVEQTHSTLLANWQTDRKSAVSLAHRLKGQMLLVHAKDCADILTLLENALGSDSQSDATARLVSSVQSSFDNATRSIRAQIPSSSPSA
jgi:signal transduction histidine kinase/ActR/RegA family two-component response regulator